MKYKLIVAFLLVASICWAQTPLPASKALTQEEILIALRGGLSNRRIETLARQFGVASDPTEADLQALRAAKADEALIAVLQESAPKGRLAREHIQLGDQALGAGYLAKAASEYTQAWQILPRRGDIGLKAAHLWKDRGEYAQCAQIVNYLVQNSGDPTRSEASQLLSELQPHLQSSFAQKLSEGTSSLGRGELPRAAQAFQDASSILPARPEPYLHLARVYARQKNFEPMTAEILLASQRNLSAGQLLGYEEFESWLDEQRFLDFLNNIYGVSAVGAAQEAKQRRELSRKNQARMKELQARIPELERQAGEAEALARQADSQAQAAGQQSQSSYGTLSLGGVFGGMAKGSEAKKWRKKQQEYTEQATKARVEAKQLQDELQKLAQSDSSGATLPGAASAPVNLNLHIATLLPETARQMGISGGVVVNMPPEYGSFGAAVKLQTNDIIVEMNSQPVNSEQDFRRIESQLRSGGSVMFKVLRMGSGTEGLRPSLRRDEATASRMEALYLTGTVP